MSGNLSSDYRDISICNIIPPMGIIDNTSHVLLGILPSHTGCQIHGFKSMVIVSAGCSTQFDMHSQTRSTSGVYKSQYRTLQDCKDGCLQALDCQAIDFNAGSQQCYFHTEGYLDRVVTPVSGVTQYRRTSCSQSESNIHI